MSHLIEENVNTNDPAFLYLNLHPNEEIKMIVRHHWAGFLGTLFLVLGMSLGPLLLAFAATLIMEDQVALVMPTVLLFVSGFILFLLTFLFGAWINFYYDIIFVTNERLLNVNQEGLLSRKTSELSMKQIQNVTAQVDGFLQHAFDYGLLVIETAGGGTADDPLKPGLQGHFTITDIPDPNRLARVILELHRSAVKNG